MGSDRQWQNFCEIAGRKDLSGNERYETNPLRVANRDELIQELQDLFRLRTSDEWRDLLRQAGVPHAPVQSVDEVVAGPEVAAREMVLPVRDSAGHEYRLLGSAVHWQGEPPRRPLHLRHWASTPTKCFVIGSTGMLRGSPSCVAREVVG